MRCFLKLNPQTMWFSFFQYELGVCMEVGFLGMLQNDYAVQIHKIHLINAIGSVFRKPEYLIELYYSYDCNENGEWNLFQSIMQTLAEQSNVDITSSGNKALLTTILKVMSRIMEMFAK